MLGFEVPAESPADVPLPACKNEVSVSTTEDFETAVGAASPGDCLVLADGNYEAFKMTGVTGTAAAPIVIRSETLHGAKLNDEQLHIIDSSHLVFEGLTLATPSSMKLENCSNCRFTRNQFALTVDDDWVVVFGAKSGDNRFDHNDFGPKETPGPFLVLGQEDTMSLNDRIDHNYFHDNGPPAVNEKESVRIGWSGVYEQEANAVVEHNLFENCDGDPEIISVKTHSNIVRHNTLRTSLGTLSLRHGNGTYLYGNYVLGGKKEAPCKNRDAEDVTCFTGGIRIYGQDHKVFNNYIQGTSGTGYLAAIQIDGGDGTAASSHHPVVGLQLVANTLVGNTVGIEVGRNYDKGPKDSIIAYNLVVAPEGTGLQLFKPDATIKYVGNIFWSENGSTNVGTMFSPEEAAVVDPMLESAGELMRLSAGSPAIDGAAALAPILTSALGGQARDAMPDIGAQELGGMAAPPLTEADVGPNSP